MALHQLINDIRACNLCANELPCAPKPIFQVHSSARLRIIGQAPGRKAHATGIPWNDMSGERLREWLGISKESFYDTKKVAIIPIGLCYPGKAKTGDMPPRRECAPRWHLELNKYLPDIKLTLLIGQYAQAYYLGSKCKSTLTETVKSWEEYSGFGYLPLPHPSPRNQFWFNKNQWFEKELIPELQKRILELSF